MLIVTLYTGIPQIVNFYLNYKVKAIVLGKFQFVCGPILEKKAHEMGHK